MLACSCCTGITCSGWTTNGETTDDLACTPWSTVRFDSLSSELDFFRFVALVLPSFDLSVSVDAFEAAESDSLNAC
jgi:hypothetical protein